MSYLLLSAAGLFPLMIWTATRTADMFSLPDSSGNPRFIALGFAAWWPAYIISDGMPFFVDIVGPEVAAAGMLSMVLGNVAIFIPWHRLVHDKAMLRHCGLIGCATVALLIVSTSNIAIMFAAFWTGFGGAASNVVMWGYVSQYDDIDIKLASVGITIGGIVSACAMVVAPNAPAYVTLGVMLQLSALAIASKIQPPNDRNAPSKKKDETAHFDRTGGASGSRSYLAAGLYGVMNGVAYAVPGLLPGNSATGWTYRGAVVATNIADMAGRSLADISRHPKIDLTPLGVPTAFFTTILLIEGALGFAPPIDPVLLLTTVSSFHVIRGDVSTVILAKVKREHPAQSREMGFVGQLGAVLGGLLTWAILN